VYRCNGIRKVYNSVNFVVSKNDFLTITGNALIVLAIVDVDASNKSYYGEQNLFLLLTNSESSSVPLGK